MHLLVLVTGNPNFDKAFVLAEDFVEVFPLGLVREVTDVQTDHLFEIGDLKINYKNVCKRSLNTTDLTK